jgi:hypothetical protein
MLYTIGYQRLGGAGIARIARGLDAVLIDVRAKPVSRIPGCSGRALRESLGAAMYNWRGRELGGDKPHYRKTDPVVVDWLRRFAGHRSLHGILLCMEEAPGDCHRHRICLDLALDAHHIFRDELIHAAELARSVALDDAYEVAGSLRALLAPA